MDTVRDSGKVSVRLRLNMLKTMAVEPVSQANIYNLTSFSCPSRTGLNPCMRQMGSARGFVCWTRSSRLSLRTPVEGHLLLESSSTTKALEYSCMKSSP
jgi:hypothetical protein